MKENSTIDYYEFLGLSPEQIPYPDSKENRILLKSILDSKFRQLAVIYHPDRGGSESNFKMLLRAITVLGDGDLRAKYDGLEFSQFNDASFKVDWEKYFNYNPESVAADFGHNLAQKISEITECKILTEPSKREHGYIWTFGLSHQNQHLTLSLVVDEDEILALTDGHSAEMPLSFKVHLYFPINVLKITTDKTEAIKIPGTERYLISPNLTSAKYYDITLLSTTSETKVNNYLSCDLLKDLALVENGDFTNNTVEEVKYVFESKVMKELDKKMLDAIFEIKAPKVQADEKADEFLSKIKSKPITRITEVVVRRQK